MKQGVTGVFAGTAFKPDERVIVGGQAMSLASYANRMNVNLLKAADFNERLREHGCKLSVTVQSICKAARDEKEVREILESIWHKPVNAEVIMTNTIKRNKEMYDFERMLEIGDSKMNVAFQKSSSS